MAFPNEMKAQAVALLILGHSCRRVQTELSRQFPGADIPHFSTLARWLNKIAGGEAIAAAVYWSFVSKAAGEIVLKRLETEAKRMSFMELVQFSSVASDTYFNAVQRRKRVLGDA